MGTLFVFRELNVPDALRVALADDDAPYGKAEEQAAFVTGGALIHKRRKLPGRRGALFHVQAVDDEPLEVQGAFRDHRMGRNHADDMRKRINRIRERANLLRVSWDGQSWTALLTSAKFGQEDRGHVTYELRFDIAQPDDVPTRAPEQRRADSDTVDRILADLRARRARMAPRSADLLNTLNNVMSGVENALDTFSTTLRQVEQTTGTVSRQVRRVTSLGFQVQQRCADARRTLRTMERRALQLRDQVQDAVAWENYIGGLNDGLHNAAATCRDAVEQQRKRDRQATRLYRVKPGDTLERIAQSMLGDAGRAGDLGLTAGQVIPGAVVRIPATNGRSS